MDRAWRPSRSPSSVAGVAAAKGGALASLDTPIPRDAEPGTEIDVAWRAWTPDGGTDWPFSGSPVFIRLVSADGGPIDRDHGPREPAGLRALRGHDRHPVRWRGARRGGPVRRVVRRRHMHALRPPVRAPRGPARSAGGGSSRGRARSRPRQSLRPAGPWPRPSRRQDPAPNLPIAVAIIAAGVLLLVVAVPLARRTRRAEPAAADDTGPAGSRPRPPPVSDVWLRPPEPATCRAR